MIYKTLVLLEDLPDILTIKMKNKDVIEIEATNERDVFVVTVRENEELSNKLRGK